MPDDALPNSPFSDLPVELRVTVGHARPTIAELMALERDAVLPLDRAVTDPVEIYVGDRLIATGQLEEVEDNDGRVLAVRLTSVPGLPRNAT